MTLLLSKSRGNSPLETQDGQFASLKQQDLEHIIPAEGILWSDINKENQGSVLTDLGLVVQPTSACSAKYSGILNDELNDFHYLIKETLPQNFNEDSLICGAKPGKTSGSCPGDSGGIFMNNMWKPDLGDYRAIQTAVVHGAPQRCNGGRYPSIFVRIDNDEALSWIKDIAFSNGTYLNFITYFF